MNYDCSSGLDNSINYSTFKYLSDLHNINKQDQIIFIELIKYIKSEVNKHNNENDKIKNKTINKKNNYNNNKTSLGSKFEERNKRLKL